MCGRFTLRTPAHVIAKYFDVSFHSARQLALRFNIAPTQDVPAVRRTERERELAMMRWGLIPSWANDPKVGNRMINARSESAAEKPAFRSAMKQRRCLVPADGFFEWKTEAKQKQPYYIRLRDDGPFAFAGLWEKWNEIESCTILTTSANGLLKPFHDRMPVILSPRDYDSWLHPNTTDVQYLFEPYPANELIAYPVNRVVNDARAVACSNAG